MSNVCRISHLRGICSAELAGFEVQNLTIGEGISLVIADLREGLFLASQLRWFYVVVVSTTAKVCANRRAFSVLELHVRLNPEARRRIVSEHLPDADVLGQGLRRLVPGLAHDVPFVGSIHRRLRHAARAE